VGNLGKLCTGLFKTTLGIVLTFILLTDTAFARAPGVALCESLFRKPESLVIRANPFPVKPRQAIALREHANLKVVTWNIFNFKIQEAEYPPGSEIARKTPRNEQFKYAKSHEALVNIKRVLEDLDADILVLQEVFSKASLEYFVREYLENQYDVVLERGNDPRGIQVGFLIKKSLNVEYELQSHKHLRLSQRQGVYPAGTPIFSRDLPALYLRQKDGSNSRASDDPDLVVLGAHFKSKRPTPGDFESNLRREIEAETAARIFQDINQRYGGRVPIALLLDTNTRQTSPEIQSLRSVTRDSLDLMGRKISKEERVTHTFHPHKAPLDAKQVDAQLLNDAMANLIKDSYVYRFKDQNGQEKVYEGKWETKIYPIQFSQRKKNPSDHFPVVGIYDMTKK
jgi:hypothetical protein